MKKLLVILLSIGFMSCEKDGPTFIENNYYTTPPTNSGSTTPVQIGGIVLNLPFSGNSSGGEVIGAKLTTDRFNKPNSAYKFQYGNYIKYTPSILGNDLKSFTISAWVLFENYPSIDKMCIMSRERRLNSTGYSLSINSYGQLVGGMNDEYKNYEGFDKRQFYIPQKQWVMVTFSYDDLTQTAKTYYQTTLLSKEFIKMNLFTNNTNLYIGKEFTSSPINTGNRYFIGSIDDVKIFDRALTDNEIKILYVN